MAIPWRAKNAAMKAVHRRVKKRHRAAGKREIEDQLEDARIEVVIPPGLGFEFATGRIINLRDHPIVYVIEKSELLDKDPDQALFRPVFKN